LEFLRLNTLTAYANLTRHKFINLICGPACDELCWHKAYVITEAFIGAKSVLAINSVASQSILCCVLPFVE